MIGAGPTALWYAARSSGYVSLLLLTAIIVLGVVTSVRWSNRDWPRFLNQALHRNLSLTVLVFLLVHIVTSVADPFAGIAVLNTVAPFTGSYRPIWLGLGVVSVELLVALTATSLLRHRIGFRTWRVIHWAAYVCWPAAILHTLGTGSDVRSFWAVVITLACIGTVFAVITWRLIERNGVLARVLWTGAGLAATVAVLGFAVAGPLQGGWARAAGTPPQLLATSSDAASAAATPSLPAGLSDAVRGSVVPRGSGVEAVFTDARDPNLRLTLTVDRTGTVGTLVVTENGVTLCTSAAQVSNIVTATCASTAVTISVAQQPDGSLSGRLQTAASGQ